MFGYQNDNQSTNDQSGNAAVAATPPATTGGWDSPAPANPTSVTAVDNLPPQPANPELEALASSADSPSTDLPAAHEDLLNIKQQALGQLSPLIDHLDQTPEEKFNTTMMMIQASDNQGLIKAAYDAAQQITDEKKRAQALLDIVNEINYFTHKDQLDGAQQ